MSPNWLNALGGKGVDFVAVQAYLRIGNMLRLNLKHVHVEDILLVLNSGCAQPCARESFDNRKVAFDHMALARMKRLNIAAHRKWRREQAQTGEGLVCTCA